MSIQIVVLGLIFFVLTLTLIGLIYLVIDSHRTPASRLKALKDSISRQPEGMGIHSLRGLDDATMNDLCVWLYRNGIAYEIHQEWIPMHLGSFRIFFDQRILRIHKEEQIEATTGQVIPFKRN